MAEAIAPYTNRAVRIFSALREKHPKAEVCHLLRRMNLSRGQLISVLAQELTSALSNLTVQLVDEQVDLSNGNGLVTERIGPTLQLLNLAKPRDFMLDRSVLYDAMLSFHSGTLMHSLQVGDMAMAMAGQLGFSVPDRERLLLGSRFHDIGKLAVPLEILDKPDALTKDERKIMEAHQAIGYLILKGIGRFAEIAEIMKYTHIEQGYPEWIKGEEVPLIAHVLIVADTFDACLSFRRYRANNRLALYKVLEIAASHAHPRHPVNVLLAAARASDINDQIAARILKKHYPQTEVSAALGLKKD